MSALGDMTPYSGLPGRLHHVRILFTSTELKIKLNGQKMMVLHESMSLVFRSQPCTLGWVTSLCPHVPTPPPPASPSAPPSTSAIRSASPGLQSKSQRLGVIPLVLFWNLSGSSSLKSLNLQTEETNRWPGLKCAAESCWLGRVQRCAHEAKGRGGEDLAAATAVILNI